MIIIEITGGCLNAVYRDGEDDIVTLIDWDHLENGGESTEVENKCIEKIKNKTLKRLF